MEIEELLQTIEGRQKLRSEEFWREIADELAPEELEAALKAFSLRFFKLSRHRLKRWIRSRVEKNPYIRTAQVLEEIEKIFSLPLSYDPALAEELKQEVRRAKNAARERLRRRRLKEVRSGEAGE